MAVSVNSLSKEIQVKVVKIQKECAVITFDGQKLKEANNKWALAPLEIVFLNKFVFVKKNSKGKNKKIDLS